MLVPSKEFRSRLLALETWLWDRCAPQHRLDVPSIDVLAERVRDLSDLYTLERDQLARAGARHGHLLARLLYFLASDAPKLHLILQELAGRGVLTQPGSRPWRSVVDLGCGLGATTAGLLLSLAPREEPLRLVGFDSDPTTLDLWAAVAGECAAIAGLRVELVSEPLDLRRAEISPETDLVLCQAALNELTVPWSSALPTADASERHEESVVELIHQIARRSLTILIEPALRSTTRPLHHLRDSVLRRGSIRVLAPCPHQADCPMLASPRDWCHEIRGFPATPKVTDVQRLTQRRDERVKYSFVVLAPESAQGASMAAALNVSDGGDSVTARLVSDSLATRGKTERFCCTEGGTIVRLRLLDREQSTTNRALAEAPRGTLVRIRGLGDRERVTPEVSVEPLVSGAARPARPAD